MGSSPDHNRNTKPAQVFDAAMLIWGMVLGAVAGGLVMLFNAPKRGKDTRESITDITQSVRERIETAIPSDPMEDSLAEGKAAARRRREELGLDSR